MKLVPPGVYQAVRFWVEAILTVATVGQIWTAAGAPVTVTVAVETPDETDAALKHSILYVEFSSGETDWLPPVALWLPLKSAAFPTEVQLLQVVAPLVVQVSVLLLLAGMVAGAAVRVTVGAPGGSTVTLTLFRPVEVPTLSQHSR